jgi:pimeloyl-ACP methyl ester carboxylesterase
MEVTTPDGRTLLVHDGGAPDGRAVVYHHGTPGWGRPYPHQVEAAAAQGLRVIGYDRPGYGGSTRFAGRSVGDCADDVAAILDALGIERFATYGWSGGGPHALACGALLGDRCAAAASLAGVAPHDAAGLGWMDGMGEDNVKEFSAAQDGEETLRALLAPQAAEMADATASDLAAGLSSILSPVDVQAMGGPLGAWLTEGFHGALEPGIDGWVDDDLAFVADWGFSLDEISVPVAVWQGDEDRMVPAAHGRWLLQQLRDASGEVSATDGHLTLAEDRFADVLAWFARYTF